jgi:cystathionine beta-lyase
MAYNFSKNIDRTGTASVKYDLRMNMFERGDVLPMWVADMDIEVAPFIMEALSSRLKHPLLGYTIRNEEYNQSIAWWQHQRYNWKVNTKWITYTPGVVAGLSHAVQSLTSPGEKVLIQTPVYHPFYSAVKLNGRELLTNPLLLTNGHYHIDFDHFEKQIASGVKLFILCNPHNPVGRVWNRHELQHMAEICLAYGVTIVADEIHADIVYEPHSHIPIASLSDEIQEQTITFNAPSKTFNVAGLATAYAIISDKKKLDKFNLQLEKNGTWHGNLLGYIALQAAYTPQGELWLAQLLEHLRENISLVKHFLSDNIPSIRLINPESTYLLWLDFREFKLSPKELNRRLIWDANLGLNDGKTFGVEGLGFQRMNIGCNTSTVEEALKRLQKVFN